MSTNTLIDSEFINFADLKLNIVPTNSIFGKVNKADAPKFKWQIWQTKQYEGKLNSTRNTILMCGRLPSKQGVVIVFDLDGHRHAEDKTLPKIPVSQADFELFKVLLKNAEIYPFMVRRSGSGGYHLLCLAPYSLHNYTTKHIIMPSQHFPTIEAVDVLAEGCLIFYQCKFLDTGLYITLETKEVVQYTTQEHIEILIESMKNSSPTPNIEGVSLKNSGGEVIKVNTRKALIELQDKRLLQIKNQYYHIWRLIVGELRMPSHGASFASGRTEFDYWKATCRCMLHVGFTISDMMKIFALSQVEEYESETFAYQAKRIENNKNKYTYDMDTKEWKWISNAFYYELFPLKDFPEFKKVNKQTIIKKSKEIYSRPDFFVNKARLTQIRAKYMSELNETFQEDKYKRIALLAGCGFGKSYTIVELAQLNPNSQFVVVIPYHNITESKGGLEETANRLHISNCHIYPRCYNEELEDLKKDKKNCNLKERHEQEVNGNCLCMFMSGSTPRIPKDDSFPPCRMQVFPKYEYRLRDEWKDIYDFSTKHGSDELFMTCNNCKNCEYKAQFEVALTSQIIICTDKMYKIFFGSTKEFELQDPFVERVLVFDESFEQKTLDEYKRINTQLYDLDVKNHQFKRKDWKGISSDWIQYDVNFVLSPNEYDTAMYDAESRDLHNFFEGIRKELSGNIMLGTLKHYINDEHQKYIPIFGFHEFIPMANEKIILFDGTSTPEIITKILDGDIFDVKIIQVKEYNSFNVPQKIERYLAYKNGKETIKKHLSKIVKRIQQISVDKKVLIVCKECNHKYFQELFPSYDVIHFGYCRGSNEYTSQHDVLVIVGRFAYAEFEHEKYTFLGFTKEEIQRIELSETMQGIQRERLLAEESKDVEIIAFTDPKIFSYITPKKYKTLV